MEGSPTSARPFSSLLFRSILQPEDSEPSRPFSFCYANPLAPLESFQELSADMSPFCRAKEKKSPAIKQSPTSLTPEPLPMECSSSAVADVAGEGTSGAIKRSLDFVTKRVKRHRSLSSLVALSDSNLPSPSHSLFSHHSPQSSASSIHIAEFHDIEPAKGGFQELKHFKVNKNGVKTHPHNFKDAPYMQCYDDMALKNDWYTLSLLKKLMPKHSPTFHDYRHRPPARVLDLGCGQGYWVVEAATAWKAWNVKVTGLDLVDLTTNAWDLEKQVADNVTWIRHNFVQYRLPFPDNSFDLVRVANMNLAVPFDRWSFIFVEANRVLSDGGRLELIDDHLFFPYVSPPSMPSPVPSPSSLKSTPAPSSSKSTPAPSPQFARSRPLTPSPLAQSRPLPPPSPNAQTRRLPQLPSSASPPVAKPSRPSKSPARFSTAPLPAPTSKPLTISPRAMSPALKSARPSKSPARPLPPFPRSSSHASSPPAPSPALKPLPPKSPARPPSNALPKSSPSRASSPALKSSRPSKSPARPSTAPPPVLVPPPRVSSSAAPASPPAPLRPLRKRPPTPMRPLPSPPCKEVQAQAQAQDASSDEEWGNKPSPKVLADPYDDWRYEMSNCNDLETIFSRMIWSKYGVHPRPAEVIGKMVEFAFGGAPKMTSLNVCLPSRSFIDSQAREMKARKVPEFEARISWFVNVDWGREKEEGKEKADKERKDKDKGQGQKDSVRVTGLPAAGISGKAAKMLGTSNLSPAGPPYQQSGLVLFPATFLHMSPAEVEMHTCRNLHFLIGSSAALHEYMHEFKDKDGKPMVSSKDLEDALWDYQTFRRKRFNWPSDLPELRMFDPVPEKDTQKDPRSSLDSARAMRTSIDSVRPERKGGPPAKSQLFNPRQSSEGLTTVRSFRIFEAYKGGPPPPRRAP